MSGLTTIKSNSLGVVHALTVLGDGRVLTVSGHMPSGIQVFDQRGAATGLVGGRPGDGPGEFRDIVALIAEGSDLHVLDMGSNRWTTLDSDLNFVKMRGLPHWPLGGLVWKDSLVINAAIRSKELAGYPLHMLNDEGRLVRSWGYDSLTFRVDVPYAGNRELAVCQRTGALWSAEKRAYRLTANYPNGSVRVLAHERAWFKPHYNAPRFQPDAPPPPVITAIQCDELNRLWVLVSVADPRWRESLVRVPSNGHQAERYGPSDRDRYFDTIIEVLDAESGELVARGRTDEYLTFFPRPGIVGSYKESPSGEPSVRVWRITIK